MLDSNPFASYLFCSRTCDGVAPRISRHIHYTRDGKVNIAKDGLQNFPRAKWIAKKAFNHVRPPGRLSMWTTSAIPSMLHHPLLGGEGAKCVGGAGLRYSPRTCVCDRRSLETLTDNSITLAGTTIFASTSTRRQASPGIHSLCPHERDVVAGVVGVFAASFLLLGLGFSTYKPSTRDLKVCSRITGAEVLCTGSKREEVVEVLAGTGRPKVGSISFPPARKPHTHILDRCTTKSRICAIKCHTTQRWKCSL